MSLLQLQYITCRNYALQYNCYKKSEWSIDSYSQQIHDTSTYSQKRSQSVQNTEYMYQISHTPFVETPYFPVSAHAASVSPAAARHSNCMINLALQIRVDKPLHAWERGSEVEKNSRPRLPRSGTLWKRKREECEIINCHEMKIDFSCKKILNYS